MRNKENQRMNYHVKVGASISEGLEAVKTFKRLKLGNFILTNLPLNKQEALAICNFCRENKICFVFSEFLYRGTFSLYRGARKKIPKSQFYNKETLEEIFRAGGEYFFGRITLGEVGGMLYWPKEYLIKRAAGEYRNLPVVKNVLDAKRVYMEFMKKVIDFEKKLGESKLLDADSNMLFKYHLEAGIDIPLLEALPGDSNLMYAAIRGAARAYHRKVWGAHIAMACYGGMGLDACWFKRWKTSLYYSFLAGADFIYLESGHFGYAQHGKIYDFHRSEMQKSRNILREFNQFSQIHSRPKNGPKVRIGFVYGNLDGTPGLWNKYVWGQFKGRKWLSGPPEQGWDYLDRVYHKEEWFKEWVKGYQNEGDFSGNPPYGQYDIVPVESSADILGKYGCLIFLGWNTMSEEIYQKLKTYVSSGGHLIMAVPHLSTHIDRANDLNLYRKGDYHDLFGVIVTGKGKKDVVGVKYFNESSLPPYKFPVWRINTDPRFLGEITEAKVKITGAKVLAGYSNFYKSTVDELSKSPFLTENSLGKGKAFLINTFSYPGEKGMELFMNNLLRVIYLGEQGDLRIIGSDKIRYSVYEESGLITIYLLNTEFDGPHLIDIWIKGKTFHSLKLPATEMRLLYYYQDLAISPEDRFTDLKFWKAKGNRHEIEFFSLRNQKLDIYNLSDNKQNVEINGKKIFCISDSRYSLPIKRRSDPSRRTFFDLNFIKEPIVKYKFGELPY